MNEDQARKAQAQNREFPETLEILARIRSALAEKLFKTEVLDSKNREEIFLRVQSLDAMKEEMESLLAANASEQDISLYIESLATTGEK